MSQIYNKMANSVDSNERACYELSLLDLYCLHKSVMIFSVKRVNPLIKPVADDMLSFAVFRKKKAGQTIHMKCQVLFSLKKNTRTNANNNNNNNNNVVCYNFV